MSHSLEVLIRVGTTFFAFVCVIPILASPRIFRRWPNRLVAAIMLLSYAAITVLCNSARVADLIPLAVLFCLIRKLEHERTDRPMKASMLRSY